MKIFSWRVVQSRFAVIFYQFYFVNHPGILSSTADHYLITVWRYKAIVVAEIDEVRGHSSFEASDKWGVNSDILLRAHHFIITRWAVFDAVHNIHYVSGVGSPNPRTKQIIK